MVVKFDERMPIGHSSIMTILKPDIIKTIKARNRTNSLLC